MKKIFAVFFVVCLQVMSAYAQNTTGKIIGTVSAPDGVIAGATVVVTDNQTGRERTVVTSSSGTFEVSQLEFGTYVVRITASGYKTLVTNDVKIEANREYPLNASLELGTITEEVTVTAEGAESVNSSNAELSTTVTAAQIRELPLNGRNVLALLNLQAGVNATTSSINGQRSGSTSVTRDGLNIQDNFIRTGVFVQDRPSVDDTGEFTITTQNAGVEQGGGSSLVQVVTPRGGSSFHGNLYAFNRNSEFAANSFTNNERNLPRPFLNRNQFGGSLSGPAPLPGFGEGTPAFFKDKGFFFFNYEGFRQAQQVTATGTTLLAPARNGDFTYTDSAGTLRTANILSGMGLNTAGANAPVFTGAGGSLGVNPIIQSRLLALLPTSANGVLTGTNFLQSTSFLRSSPVKRDAWTGRFDIEFNDENSFNFVYKRNNEANARTDLAAGFSPTPFVNQGGPTNFFVAAYRMTPSSSFSNEIRAGLQYSEPFFNESNIPTDYLIGQTLVTTPEGSFRSQGRTTNYRNIQDNAVYTIGNHSLRFGGQAELFNVDAVNFAGTTPVYNISSTANTQTPGLTAALFPGGINTTDLGRANALRYLLAGIVGSGTLTANLTNRDSGYGFGPALRRLNYNSYSAYFSDQWRIMPNLTLNLGLRYELYTPLNTPDGLYLEPVFPDPDDISSVARAGNILNFVGTNVGSEGDFHKADKDNFAPSVSFAYTPNFTNRWFSGLVGTGTVIRGGFRVSYVNDEYVRAADAFNLANTGLGSLLTNARSSTGSTNLRSTLSPTAGFEPLPGFVAPTFTAPPRTFITNNPTALGGVFGVDPNLQLQRVYEYNIGIQREIGFKSVVEIRYVGSRSNSAIRSIDYNQLDTINNGFFQDFLRAQNNCRLQGAAANPTAPNPLLVCTDARYNPAIVGSQPLTIFNNLGGGTAMAPNPGNLNIAAYVNLIQRGQPGDLAQLYIGNRLSGTVVFQPTSDIFATDILTNGGLFRYNALQAEVRRRFSNGFSYQVNYTFQKTLGDVPDDSQLRQSPYQDNNNPRLQYGRPDFDRTHTVNANMVYELPFGKGKKFINQGGLMNAIFGGFQFSSIVNLSSGPPLGVIDPRGTSARAGRSGRQSATSSLTTAEIKDLMGEYNTPNGIYFVNPSVLFATARDTRPGPTFNQTQRIDLTQPLPTGFVLVSVRATNPLGQAPFDGQVFFFNPAGSVGNLPRNFINGLPFLNWDASLNKNFRFGETNRLQLRMEAFNVLNKQVPFFGADLNIDSNNFGLVTGRYNAARVIQFGARFDF